MSSRQRVDATRLRRLVLAVDGAWHRVDDQKRVNASRNGNNRDCSPDPKIDSCPGQRHAAPAYLGCRNVNRKQQRRGRIKRNGEVHEYWVPVVILIIAGPPCCAGRRGARTS